MSNVLYKTDGEKELFQKLLPEIDEVKNSFKKSNYKGHQLERDIIDCINNEIHHVCNDKDYHKRLGNHSYKTYINEIKDSRLQDTICSLILEIARKIDKFEKEYFERV